MHSSQQVCVCVLSCQCSSKKTLDICSDAGGSRSRSTPDHSLLVDPMNDPMMDSDTIGQRLANPTDSPLHRLGNRKLSVHPNQALIHDISFAFSQHCRL